mgnify:CR=1 FL=1
MHLDTYKDAAVAVSAGRNVVCRVGSHREALDTGRAIMNATHHGWSHSQSNPYKLRCMGGLLHLVIHEHEAAGMEYHDSIGVVGALIASRVRLDPNHNIY